MSKTTIIPTWSAGDRFRKAREITGMDRKQFADTIGIHRETVARYESEGTTKPMVLRAYAMMTGVDEQWLRSGEQGPLDYKATVSHIRNATTHPANRRGNTGPKGRA